MSLIIIDLPNQIPFIKVIDIMTPNVKIYSFGYIKEQICIDILGLEYNQCYGTDDQKNELVDYYQNDNQLTARKLYKLLE